MHCWLPRLLNSKWRQILCVKQKIFKFRSKMSMISRKVYILKLAPFYHMSSINPSDVAWSILDIKRLQKSQYYLRKVDITKWRQSKCEKMSKIKNFLIKVGFSVKSWVLKIGAILFLKAFDDLLMIGACFLRSLMSIQVIFNCIKSIFTNGANIKVKNAVESNFSSKKVNFQR